MSFEGQSGIGFRHALTIVDHLHARFTGVGHNHLDARCAGVNRILNEFLDE